MFMHFYIAKKKLPGFKNLNSALILTIDLFWCKLGLVLDHSRED